MPHPVLLLHLHLHLGRPRIDLQVLNLQRVRDHFCRRQCARVCSQGPSRIHCVNTSPCQNHLLELELVAINNLECTEFWRLFGQGKYDGFRRLLTEKLSPVLSWTVIQSWYKNRATSDKSFYDTSCSSLAFVLFKWFVWAKGLGSVVHQVSTMDALSPQVRLWEQEIKPATLPE